MPYLALLYEQRGMAGRKIGILTSIPPIVTLFAASIWSGLADITQSHRRLMILAIIGAICSATGIYFSNGFITIAAMVAVFALFNSPIIPFVDNTAMKLLAGEEQRYGKLRLWGAIGWGISAPLIGLLVSRHNMGWPFYGFVIYLFLGLLTIIRLPIERSVKNRGFRVGFIRMMGNPNWILFLIVIFISGTGSSMIHNYLFLYMNHLNTGPILMGLSLTVATVSEVVVFAFSDRLIIRWGIRNVLMLAVITLAVRLLAYSVASSGWLVLIIQISHGLTFSLLWVAGVAFANRNALPGLETTAQGIFSGVFMGLAAAVGAFAGGWLYEGVGPFMMYRWAAIGIGVLVLIVGLIWSIRPDDRNRGEI